MKTFALVGRSGTGKSYQAMNLAQREKIECIIDDGLLIANHKIIAGTSAKKEKTKISSVKHAIFFYDDYAEEMKTSIKNANPDSILVLGTSEKMVKKIQERLNLPKFDRIFTIEEISTEDDIQLALFNRTHYGKHVIPVPTFEIKQDFSGYFLRSLKIFKRKTSTGEITQENENSIIRPTYSYLGEFTISDNVISQMIEFELLKLDFIDKILSIRIDKLKDGLGAEISLNIKYGIDLNKAGDIIKSSVAFPVANCTSINVQYINVNIKGIIL